MSENQLDSFIRIYQALNQDRIKNLEQIYHPDIQFSDPLHQINGIEPLKLYLSQMYQNTLSCDFKIISKQLIGNEAYLSWLMTYRHKKIGSGKAIEVNGVSHLKFEQAKVIHHRDYFDLSQMLFDHLPVIGRLTRYIKKKAVDA